MDGMLSQDDVNCSDVDAELHGAIIQKLLAKSCHYPWIQGQRGARRGIIRRVGQQMSGAAFLSTRVQSRIRLPEKKGERKVDGNPEGITSTTNLAIGLT